MKDLEKAELLHILHLLTTRREKSTTRTTFSILFSSMCSPSLVRKTKALGTSLIPGSAPNPQPRGMWEKALGKALWEEGKHPRNEVAPFMGHCVWDTEQLLASLEMDCVSALCREPPGLERLSTVQDTHLECNHAAGRGLLSIYGLTCAHSTERTAF